MEATTVSFSEGLEYYSADKEESYQTVGGDGRTLKAHSRGEERPSEKAMHTLTLHPRTFWKRQNDPGSERITAWTVQVMEK